jgi:hypothetical protein
MSPKDFKDRASMEREREILACMSTSIHRGGVTQQILNQSSLRQSVMTCYVITIKVMRSYYKGECTLNSLSVVNFCANGAVFNWCSYLLEELLVACEEVQEKGGNFTYKYILLDFVMLKWRPPMRRQLAPVDKGLPHKYF